MIAIENIFIKYIKLRNKLDNAKIYKIVDNTNNNIYIGSTCDSLNQRLSKHKCAYKRFKKGLFNNIKSFDILKNDNYKIELLENCNIKTKQELLSRERYFIENNECLNKNIPGRTLKDFQQYQKDYRESNKDKAKGYYVENKDKLIKSQKEYYNNNKEKAKDYYIRNKDKLIKSQKEYNAKNKEKIREKIICECGGKFTYCHKSQHIKSTIHLNFLESLK